MKSTQSSQQQTQLEQQAQIQRSASWTSSLLLIGGIIVVVFLLMYWINNSEPTAEREPDSTRAAMLVSVEPLQRANFTPIIQGLGQVQAAQEVLLQPQVSGRVLNLSPAFMPGQVIAAGDLILTIDPADQLNVVKTRKSAVAEAQAALDIELGQRNIAKQEFALLKREINANNQALILREPQLAAAEASLDAAKAALAQAELDLARTEVRAPFTAQVLSRAVNVGSQVSSGTQLAHLAGTNEYWVEVSVAVAQLAQIELPKAGELGALVSIRDRTAWPVGQTRQGRLLSVLGNLDGDTRLARLLVAVSDPLALSPETDGPPLLIDTIVQAQVSGRTLENVFRVRREHVHEGNTLRLNRDGVLVISPATVVFRDAEYAYLSDGIQAGDELVVSNLSTFAPGVALRTIPATDASGQETTGAGQ